MGRVAAWAKRRGRDGLPARARVPKVALPALGLPALVGAVLLIGILGEGAGHLGHPVVPQPASAEIGLPGPVMDLPTDGALDRMWQYFSTDGFPKIPIGNSTFDIPAVDDLRGGMDGFPDKASVEKLRYYGIRTVVLHTVLPKGLPPEQGCVIPEPPDPAANAPQADRRPRHHAPPGGLGRDLRDRPRAEGPARHRLMSDVPPAGAAAPPPLEDEAAHRRARVLAGD